MSGILDRATLTLGDNRRVLFPNHDLSHQQPGRESDEFIMRPKLGSAAHEAGRDLEASQTSGDLTDKISRAATEAARRKFTPEFMNRRKRSAVFTDWDKLSCARFCISNYASCSSGSSIPSGRTTLFSTRPPRPRSVCWRKAWT